MKATSSLNNSHGLTDQGQRGKTVVLAPQSKDDAEDDDDNCDDNYHNYNDDDDGDDDDDDDDVMTTTNAEGEGNAGRNSGQREWLQYSLVPFHVKFDKSVSL